MSRLLLFAFTLSLTVCAQTKSTIDDIHQIIQKKDIEGHIYFLADDLLKGRETGTPENKIAASYLANTLRSYGVQPNPKSGNYYQEVPLVKTTPSSESLLVINDLQLDNIIMISAKNLDYSGTAIHLGYGLEDDYQGKNVRGKVLLIKAGSPTAKDSRAALKLQSKKQELAKKAGAMAIVEFLDTEDQMWGYIDHRYNEPSLSLTSDESQPDDFSHMWVQDRKLITFNALKAKNTVTLKTKSAKKEPFISYNVVGLTEGTDPNLKDEYIIYSAHYDHVGVGKPDASGDTIYNGARDNAVGTTTVLSMAQFLSHHPTKRSALFILFTGEEKGLLGSKYYVENPILPLKQMVYCFNSDNAGYNDTSKATIIGLPRTTAEQHIKDAASAFGLQAVDDPSPEQGLFDRSDNVHFAKKGIPAPTFSLGFTAFNGDVTKYYHRPGDEAETLAYNYLEQFFKAYVMSGYLIGNDPKTPTWTTGDKYEDAGKALYGN